MGGDADAPDDGSRIGGSGQRPLATKRSDYFEPAQLNVVEGPLGELPTVGGNLADGPEPGVRDDNLICIEANGRPGCEHYVALLMPAEGVAKGFEELRQIRRFCTRMATASELFEIDTNVYACTARRPQDNRSALLIRNFEQRQKDLTAETEQTSDKLEF
jgi:hypothetical protein